MQQKVVTGISSDRQTVTMDVGTKVKLLKRFAHPERVEISENVKSVAGLVENLLVKLYVLNEHQADERIRPPRPSPLDQIKSVVSASNDLRVEHGNLSAQAIARVFGLSLNALAKILGRTRQALTTDLTKLNEDTGRRFTSKQVGILRAHRMVQNRPRR